MTETTESNFEQSFRKQLQDGHKFFRLTARLNNVHFTQLAWERYCREICATAVYQYSSSEDGEDKVIEIEKDRLVKLEEGDKRREAWKVQYPELKESCLPNLERKLTHYASEFTRQLDENNKDLFLLDSEVERVYCCLVQVLSSKNDSEVKAFLIDTPSYLDIELARGITRLKSLQCHKDELHNLLHGNVEFKDGVLERSYNALKRKFYNTLKGIDWATIQEWDGVHEPNRGFRDYVLDFIQTRL